LKTFFCERSDLYLKKNILGCLRSLLLHFFLILTLLRSLLVRMLLFSYNNFSFVIFM
jgi:hypothetical protein